MQRVPQEFNCSGKQYQIVIILRNKYIHRGTKG